MAKDGPRVAKRGKWLTSEFMWYSPLPGVFAKEPVVEVHVAAGRVEFQIYAT